MSTHKYIRFVWIGLFAVAFVGASTLFLTRLFSLRESEEILSLKNESLAQLQIHQELLQETLALLEEQRLANIEGGEEQIAKLQELLKVTKELQITRETLEILNNATPEEIQALRESQTPE
jgi:hypothetical protein